MQEFSEVVLKDLSRKMIDDMVTAGNRTINLVPEEQRGVVYFSVAGTMLVIAAKILAGQTNVDERSALQSLLRQTTKRLMS